MLYITTVQCVNGGHTLLGKCVGVYGCSTSAYSDSDRETRPPSVSCDCRLSFEPPTVDGETCTRRCNSISGFHSIQNERRARVSCNKCIKLGLIYYDQNN